LPEIQGFKNIRIVLVNPSHPGNIGAAARAMKNMGLSSLALVEPEDFPSPVARGRAVSAVDILEAASITSSLREAVKDCGLVIGASARSRRIPWPVMNPVQCAQKAIAGCQNNNVALVFGREDSGLSNEELQLCHFHVQIPTGKDYTSLNLAAAVMVICYELRRELDSVEGKTELEEDEYWDVEKATSQQMEHFYAHLEKVLIKIDFHDPENPRQLMHRMRRMFGRIRLDIMELNILRGMLTNTEYHIKKNHPGSQANNSD